MNVLFIDSGIGGISTLATCIKYMPNLNFIYYADNQFAPYGNLNARQITNRIINIIKSQLKYNVGVVVIACNTATACSIDEVRTLFSLPIIGTEPAIKPACATDRNVIVFATPATTSHDRILKLADNKPCPVDIIPLPHFAKHIDDYFIKQSIDALQNIYADIRHITKLSQNKTHIVLGCTHYIFFKNEIEEQTKCTVLDGNFGVFKQLKRFISDKFFSNNPTQKFVFSLQNSDLCKIYRKIFKQTLAKHINV